MLQNGLCGLLFLCLGVFPDFLIYRRTGRTGRLFAHGARGINVVYGRVIKRRPGFATPLMLGVVLPERMVGRVS